MKQHLLKSAIAVFGISALALLGCGKDKTPEPEPTPVPPTEGLVAFYPFNGNAQDESSANNGSTNGVQFVRNRKNEEGKAVYFDGIDDYIVVPHSGAINFGVDQDFTISLWVKYGNQNSVVSDNNDILSKWQGGYPFVVRLANQTSTSSTRPPGAWFAARYDGSTCSNNPDPTSPSISEEQFHHLVFQKKGTLLFGYTDGQKTSEEPDNTICETKNEAPLFIGARTATNQFYTGAVDDLRIYNRALSEAEIKILFEE